MTSISAGEERALRYGREVGRALKILSWEKRVNQTKLGDAIGVSNASVSKKLRGEQPITIDELMGMAEVLGVEDPGQLLPRLDSNQQPSGYTSALVGRRVLALGWAGLPDYAGSIVEVGEDACGNLAVSVRADVDHCSSWMILDLALLVPLEHAVAVA